MSGSNTRSRSNSQERKVAKDLGGRPTVGSGALSFDRADVRTDNLLVECKTTAAASYSLKAADLEKIRNQARHVAKIPVFVVEFQNRSRYAIIDYDTFIDTTRDYIR